MLITTDLLFEFPIMCLDCFPVGGENGIIPLCAVANSCIHGRLGVQGSISELRAETSERKPMDIPQIQGGMKRGQKKREKRTELIISIPQRIAQLSDMLY